MRRSYVLRLDIRAADDHFVGEVEDVETGEKSAFSGVGDLVRFLTARSWSSGSGAPTGGESEGRLKVVRGKDGRGEPGKRTPQLR
jgi:hypothetical protein